MNRSVTVYSVVVALLLGLSWMEWTAPPEVDLGDKIALMQGEAKDVERVIWKSEKEEVTVERKLDAAGSYLWVTHTKWEEPKTPKPEASPAPAEATPPTDPNAPAGATPEASATPPAEEKPPEKVAKTQVFKAGEAGDKLLDSLSPLLALRQLTDVPPEKMATLGLDTSKETLEVVRNGRSRVLEVGGEAYGSKDRYVRDKESGEIYLLDDELLRPLKYAKTRMPDRALFSIAEDKIESAVITGGMRSLDVQHKNAQDKEKASWVRAASPDAVAEQLETWMDKALQLKSSAFVAPDDMPVDLQDRFQLTIKGSDGRTETLQVQQSAEKGDWYARSEHTRGLVKLLKGPTSSLYDDVEAVTAE